MTPSAGRLQPLSTAPTGRAGLSWPLVQRRDRPARVNPYSREELAWRQGVRSVVAEAEREAGHLKQHDALRQCEWGSQLMDPGGNGRPRAPVVSVEGGNVVRRLYHCDNRLCPTCARRRSAKHVERLTVVVGERFKRRPAMVTLTQRDIDGEPLADAMARLLAGWHQLRRSTLWREHVRGGWRSVEVTRHKGAGGATRWHCHLHVVVDAEWFPQAELLELWRTCLDVDDDTSGGARIERLRKGLAEAVKYCVKPADVIQWPQRDVVELVRWMRGRRMLQTFGHLHGVTLSEDEAPGLDVVDGAPDVVNSATGDVVPAAICQWSSRADDRDAGWRLAAAAWELAHPSAACRAKVARPPPDA